MSLIIPLVNCAKTRDPVRIPYFSFLKTNLMSNAINNTQTIRSPNTTVKAAPPVINRMIAIIVNIKAANVNAVNNIILYYLLQYVSIKGTVKFAKRKG